MSLDTTETGELRKQLYNIAPAIYSPYVSPTGHQQAEKPLKRSEGLSIGSQRELIAAVNHAYLIGEPVNHMITVRWASLAHCGSSSSLFALSDVDRVLRVVELLRHWLNNRGLKSCYIWARENVASIGEHLHLAFHLPKHLRDDLTAYFGELFDEPATTSFRPYSMQKEGELACSLDTSWLLQEDTRPERHGYFLACYLGKGEPSRRMFRGKMVHNKRKPKRNGRYSELQGLIVGTATSYYRHGISQNLKPNARKKWRTTA